MVEVVGFGFSLSQSVTMEIDLTENLPDPLLKKIFSYLTHPQKLIGRFVCKKWSEEITSFLTFRTSYDKKGHQILLDTRRPNIWKKLNLFRISMLLTEMKNSIKSLELSFCINPDSSDESGFEYLTEFPSLTHLGLDITCKSALHPISLFILGLKHKKTLKNLTSLKLKFPYQEYLLLEEVLKCLTEMIGVKNMKLIKFSLKENGNTSFSFHNPKEQIQNLPNSFPFEIVANTILSNVTPLKTLELNFQSESIRNSLAQQLLTPLQGMTDLELLDLSIVLPGFSASLKNLTSLLLSFPYQEYLLFEEILKYLTEMMGENMRLVKFTVEEGSSSPKDKPKESGLFPFPVLVAAIFNNAATLKTLNLKFHSDPIKNVLAQELLTPLQSMADLQLKDLSVQLGPKAGFSEANLQSYQNVLLLQNELRAIELPWSSKLKTIVQQLMEESLSPNIQNLSGLEKGLITQGFFARFTSLKTISMTARLRTAMFEGSCPTLKQLEVDIIPPKQRQTTWEIKPFILNILLENFTSTFPNLTVLVLKTETRCEHGRASLNNPGLQSIIRGFPNLRILKIQLEYSASEITDFGVCGIETCCVGKLIETGRLYILSDPKIGALFSKEIEDNKVGHPICSLKNLEELDLSCYSEITDGGFFFGFRFGPSFKRLTVQSASKDVTDWGLYCLAKNNPKLESFDVAFPGNRISEAGKKNLKDLLPFASESKQFKLRTSLSSSSSSSSFF